MKSAIAITICSVALFIHTFLETPVDGDWVIISMMSFVIALESWTLWLTRRKLDHAECMAELIAKRLDVFRSFPEGEDALSYYDCLAKEERK